MLLSPLWFNIILAILANTYYMRASILDKKYNVEKKETKWSLFSSVPSGPINLSLVSTVFGGNRPRAPYSDHPPTSSPATSPRPSSWSFPASGTNQPWCYPFIAHQPGAPNFIKIIPLRWRPLSMAWSTCIFWPLIPTSFWASILTTKMWL